MTMETTTALARGKTFAIHGSCEPRFAGVREAFIENYRREDEIGSAFSVFASGAAPS